MDLGWMIAIVGLLAIACGFAAYREQRRNSPLRQDHTDDMPIDHKNQQPVMNDWPNAPVAKFVNAGPDGIPFHRLADVSGSHHHYDSSRARHYDPAIEAKLHPPVGLSAIPPSKETEAEARARLAAQRRRDAENEEAAEARARRAREEESDDSSSITTAAIIGAEIGSALADMGSSSIDSGSASGGFDAGGGSFGGGGSDSSF